MSQIDTSNNISTMLWSTFHYIYRSKLKRRVNNHDSNMCENDILCIKILKLYWLIWKLKLILI